MWGKKELCRNWLCLLETRQAPSFFPHNEWQTKKTTCWWNWLNSWKVLTGCFGNPVWQPAITSLQWTKYYGWLALLAKTPDKLFATQSGAQNLAQRIHNNSQIASFLSGGAVIIYMRCKLVLGYNCPTVCTCQKLTKTSPALLIINIIPWWTNYSGCWRITGIQIYIYACISIWQK